MAIRKLWVVRAANALVLSVLCSFNSAADAPAQSSTEKMSVEEARNIVLDLAKSMSFIYESTRGRLGLTISDVHIATTSIKVTVNANSKSQRNKLPYIPSTAYLIDLSNLQLSIVDKTIVEFKTRQGFELRDDVDEQTINNLAEALQVLKSAAIKFSADDDASFQAALISYQAAAVKPQLPEAARRFKVQAEGAIRDKDFDAAADLYEQALGVSPWWPEGHFNRALLLSETDDFAGAIVEMKRYLALVPDAPDARAAQDEIYDWERKAAPAN